MVSSSDSVVAGAVSGGVTRLLVAPLDVLKVRLQLQLEPIEKRCSTTAKYRGLLHAAQTVLKEEGVRAFWKGFIPGQLLYLVFGATQFGTFEACSKAAHGLFLNWTPWKVAVNFTSGCLAGLVATLTSQPFDTLRTRFIGQGEPKVYPSLYHAIVMMYSENGIRTFYKGLNPALLTVVPQAGFSFGFYHSFSGIWKTVFPQKSADDSLRPLACGALAGILSKIIVLPIDLVKKRLEVQGFEEARLSFGRVQHYQGTLDCFLSVLRQEGPLAFYKGISPSLIKAASSVALSFVVYEKTLRKLQEL